MPMSPRPGLVPAQREEFDKDSQDGLLKLLEQRNDKWGAASVIKGWVAAAAGLSIQDNPYEDKREKHGRITFSRAYRRRWFTGYNSFLGWLASKPIVDKWGKRNG